MFPLHSDSRNYHLVVMLQISTKLQGNLFIHWSILYMSRKGPEVGKGMLDFVEDLSKGVVSH